MMYRIRHETSYEFASSVTVGHHLAYVAPRSTPRQRVLYSEVNICPLPSDNVHHVDAFGNSFIHFSIQEPHTRMSVIAISEVEQYSDPRRRAINVSLDQPWELSTISNHNDPALIDFLLPSPLVPLSDPVRDFAAVTFLPGRPLGDCIAELTRRIFNEFAYMPGTTDPTTTSAEALQLRHGVCQDFAHVGVGALRAMGLPARYVSGYLETIPLPGQPKLVGADASHAWASVRTASGAWIDLDPTNDIVDPTSHITVAWGRDYTDVVPLKGVVSSSGGHTSMHVAVDVVALNPREASV